MSRMHSWNIFLLWKKNRDVHRIRKQKTEKKNCYVFFWELLLQGEKWPWGDLRQRFSAFSYTEPLLFRVHLWDVPIQATGTVEHGSCASYVWHQFLLLLRYLWHSQRWVEWEPSEPSGVQTDEHGSHKRGKARMRDSIKSKSFEAGGMGVGEGREKLF